MSFPDIFLSVDKFVGNAKLIGPDCSPRYGRSSGAVKVQLQSRSAKAAWYCHMRSRVGGACGESRLQSEALFISINCYTSDDELGIVSMISPPETTRARWDCAKHCCCCRGWSSDPVDSAEEDPCPRSRAEACATASTSPADFNLEVIGDCPNLCPVSTANHQRLLPGNRVRFR